MSLMSLESKDYSGHSLSTRRRMARAMNARLDVSFVPESSAAPGVVREPRADYGTEAGVFVIAGSNGSGKTTFACKFLPEYVECIDFINPDLIARGLSPFDPDRAMLKAGRTVLTEIAERTRGRRDFAFETTLSGQTYRHVLRNLKRAGYLLHMFYLWIPNVELALARIRDRVECGGHDVPEAAVRRRFGRALQNLQNVYRPMLDTLLFFDNSGAMPTLVFEERLGSLQVHDRARFRAIQMERSA